MLRVDHLPTMALAAFGAIASKFLFRVDSKHFFNPANLGIIIALTFTQDAWVSPGQWGEELWYALNLCRGWRHGSQARRSLGYHCCVSRQLCPPRSTAQSLPGLDLGCLAAPPHERFAAIVCPVHGDRSAFNSQCATCAVDLGSQHCWPHLYPAQLFLLADSRILGALHSVTPHDRTRQTLEVRTLRLENLHSPNASNRQILMPSLGLEILTSEFRIPNSDLRILFSTYRYA